MSNSLRTDSSSSSRRSSQSLSDKLSSQIPYGGAADREQRRQSNRKRLSLTSETSHSTASSETPAPADPLAPLSNSSSSSRSMKRSGSKRQQHPLSPTAAASPLSSLLVRDKKRQQKAEAKAPSDARSKASRGSRSSRGSRGSRASIKLKHRDGGASGASGSGNTSSIPPSTRRSSTATNNSNNTRSTSKGRRTVVRRVNSSRSQQPHQQQAPPMGSQSESQADGRVRHRVSSRSPKKKRDSASSSVRRKGSDETAMVTKTKKKRSKSTARMDDTSNNSLSYFMKKEGQTVKPPADKQEAMEVRSAFTSYSRMRNRKIAATAVSSQASALGSRDRRDRRRKNAGDQLSSSFHGDTGSMRRSKSLKELTRNGSSKRSGNSSSQKSSITAFHESFAGFGNASLSGSSGQQDDAFPDVPAFRKPLPDNPADLKDGNSETLFHQYQPTANFTSLPVLREESRKMKKTKPITRKIRKSTTSKKAPVSQQELSDFLEQCNAKREQDDAASQKDNGSKDPLSPMRSDRSCVSMPAAASSPSGRVRKSSKMAKTPPNTRSMTGKRQQSQRSFQTSNSDPLPATTSSTTTGTPSKKLGPLTEKLSEKKSRRGRQGNKNRDWSRKKDRSGSQSEMTIATAASTIPSESNHSEDTKVRSKSAANERKRPSIGDRPRSLSRTRHISHQQAQAMPSLLSMKPKDVRSTANAKTDANMKQKSRPKGMRKLFSIRDFTKCDEFESSDSSDSVVITETTLDAPGPVVRTPSQSDLGVRGQRDVSNAAPLETPLPPLVACSPVNSNRAQRSTRTVERSGHSKSPKRKHRFFPSEPTDNKDERHGSSDLSEASKQLSSDSDTPYSPRMQGEQAKLQTHSTPAGETSEELRPQPEDIRLRMTLNDEAGQQEEDALSGVEEDVFSHYTWSITVGVIGDTEHSFEDTLRERLQMKESIRQSLLFKAFEVIDMAL